MVKIHLGYEAFLDESFSGRGTGDLALSSAAVEMITFFKSSPAKKIE